MLVLTGICGSCIVRHFDILLTRWCRWWFLDITTYTLDERFLLVISDVGEVVCRWRVDAWSSHVGGFFKDVASVADLVDVSIIILAPNLSLEVVNVNPVMAAIDIATMDEDRMKTVREAAQIGELGCDVC